MLDGRLFYYDYKDNENYILIERMQMEQVSLEPTSHMNLFRTLPRRNTKVTKY